ncbi:MAG: hypothetical protein J6Q03_08060 [Paludibacteraceae bacterium]|nr:hypothetical protein [Paludibacteraceae bacterium]
MSEKFIVKTNKGKAKREIVSNFFVALFVCVFGSLLSLLSDDGKVIFFCFCLCSIIPFFTAVYFLLQFYYCKEDYIQVDAEGLTLDIHSRSFFPKHYKYFYRWENLSYYVFDCSLGRNPKGGFEWWKCSLELYDLKKMLLEKIKFQPFWGDDIQHLDEHVVKHLPFKYAYEFEKHGKTTFLVNKAKTENPLALLFSIGLMTPFVALLVFTVLGTTNESWSEIVFLGGFGFLFFLCGLNLFRTPFVTKDDYLTIEKERIEVNLHTTVLLRHIHETISHDSYHYYLCNHTSPKTITLYEQNKKKVFSFNADYLENIQHLNMIFKLFFHDKQDFNHAKKVSKPSTSIHHKSPHP